MKDNATTTQTSELSFPRYKKERFLLNLSADELLRRVVRPVLIAQGLKDVADLNGSAVSHNLFPTFVAEDALGNQDVYAVVLSRGPLNPSRAEDLQRVTEQVSEALESRLLHSCDRTLRSATKILVCSTGKMSDKARSRLQSKGSDSRVVLWDSIDIIERVDARLPEFWLGVDTEIAPYFRYLKKHLEDSSENLGIADVLPSNKIPSAVTDEMYVPLRLFRTVVRVQKNKGGEIVKMPRMEQLPLTGISRKPDRLVLILGNAGSGKSTSLKRLAFIQAAKNLSEGGPQKIPVLIRAVDCMKNATDLWNTAKQTIERIVGSAADPVKEDQFVDGSVAIMIDSFDELPDDAARQEVAEKIGKFHSRYPKCQVVLTSRPLPFFRDPDVLSGFARYNIAAIDFKQAERIVTRIQKKKSLPMANSQELLRRIQQVHGFELNPLLVTVFAATSEYERKDIPANITELFKKYTEMMLGRWDAAKGLAQQYHFPLKDFLLRKVAFEMHKRSVTSVSRADFAAFVNAELTARGHSIQADQLIEEMVMRSGLFRCVGGAIEFRHLLLQEFFAGRAVQSTAELKQFIADPWWQKALVFYFGENPGDSSALRELTDAMSSFEGGKVYTAAVTLGLAVQASYLVETTHKYRIAWCVIKGLAAARDTFLERTGGLKELPLNAFLWYYLSGRDAVSCSFLREAHQNLWDRIENDHANLNKELCKFWLIIGLIESGHLEEARKLLRSFAPQDRVVLFGAYLSAQFLRHVRVSTPAERKMAGQIADDLSPDIEPLARQMVNEWKTGLLEVRNGNVEALLE